MSLEGAGVGPHLGTGHPRLTVLAIAQDARTRGLLPKVVTEDELVLAVDLAEGLASAQADQPDIAFVEIGMGDGAGLALVHHLKAVAPAITVFALVAKEALEAGAHAMALGSAGVFLLPLGGDEVVSALANVKGRIAERHERIDLERAAVTYSRAAGWMARVAELADSPSRTAAADEFVTLLTEATGASGAAVYLTVAEKSNELVRVAASPSLESTPHFGLEVDLFDHARRARLLAVPLATRKLRAGNVLLQMPRDGDDVSPTSLRAVSRKSPAARVDGLVKLLATQAASAFALISERERAGGSAMKDPSSSAYSFAYYVDVAGREIDRARRYSRRFAIATVGREPDAQGPTPAELADLVLKSSRDTDILARIDENEFHVLLPETDGLGAHALRRRLLARIAAEKPSALVGLTVGTAAFPHDGQDLSQLLRAARRRAEASRTSVVHRLRPEPATVGDLLDALGWETDRASEGDVAAPRAFELAAPDAIAMATSVVADALRGGAIFVCFSHHVNLPVGSAVRAAVGTRETTSVHAIEAKEDDDIEVLSILAEHGAYALVARSQGGIVRGMHAADPLLAELLAERLGRAAGLRVFT